MVVVRRCKECPPGTRRKAPHPGPRCATHHRAVRRGRRAYNHGVHVQDTYSISSEQYWAIYEYQGGRCFICRRATGERRKLAVDHDHACCPGPTSCGRCVRGLLCRSCNRSVLGHLRDDPEALQRAIDYLNDPPARKVLQ